MVVADCNDNWFQWSRKSGMISAPTQILYTSSGKNISSPWLLVFII